METQKEILSQLGGNKFLAMTGCYNLLADGNSLIMSLRKNNVKAQKLVIKLNSMDTYDMEFISIDREYNRIIKKKEENVYCDMLQSIFESVTGIRTSL